MGTTKLNGGTIMIDLKETIEAVIDQAWTYEYSALEEHVASNHDWATYYENDLQVFFRDNQISEPMIVWLLENVGTWIDDNVLNKSNGYFMCSYEFSIIHTSEIEICLDDILSTPVKKSVREAINDNTDLYIPDYSDDLGYCSTDMLSVVVDANQIKTWIRNNQDITAELS